MPTETDADTLVPVPVRIRFRGFDLEVPVGDVAEVIQQLEKLGPSWERRVGTGLRPLGRPVTWPPQQSALPGVEQDDEDVKPLSDGEAHEMALRFLSALAEAPILKGLETDEVARLLGVKHPKGIGSRAAVLNKIIGSYGFDVSDVYRNPRDSSGARKWLQGPMIAALIDVMRKGATRPE